MKLDNALDDALLKASLSAAVPLWIMELREKSWTEIQRIAAECSQIVAENGDLLMFKSKKKAESAAVFNALAKGTACLAFCPGGVTFLGLHFEASLESANDPKV
jgi:hypothetical protein